MQEIVKLATWNNRVDEATAISMAKEAGLRLLNTIELQEITEDDSLWQRYKDYFPCRSGTKLSYKKGATTATIQHYGEKPKKIKFPLQDGWYITGADGIPNGAKSSGSDEDASHLWRWQDSDFTGLVARYYGGFGYGYGRVVYCLYDASIRCGVLGTKDKGQQPKGKKTYKQGVGDGRELERGEIIELLRKRN